MTKSRKWANVIHNKILIVVLVAFIVVVLGDFKPFRDENVSTNVLQKKIKKI